MYGVCGCMYVCKFLHVYQCICEWIYGICAFMYYLSLSLSTISSFILYHYLYLYLYVSDLIASLRHPCLDYSQCISVSLHLYYYLFFDLDLFHSLLVCVSLFPLTPTFSLLSSSFSSFIQNSLATPFTISLSISLTLSLSLSLFLYPCLYLSLPLSFSLSSALSLFLSLFLSLPPFAHIRRWCESKHNRI